MNTKIHYYKRDKSPQIIVSKLFTLNSVYQHHHAQQHLDSPRRRSFSSINSDRSSFMANSSLCEDNVSEQSSDDDHFSISSSIYPPVVGLCQSTKRTRRFSQTNMENGSFSPTPLPTPRLSSHDNVSCDQLDEKKNLILSIACTTYFKIRQICCCYRDYIRRKERDIIRLYLLSFCFD